MKIRNGLLAALVSASVLVSLVSACGGDATRPRAGSQGTAGGNTVALSRSTATEPATWKPIDVPDELLCSQPAPDPTRGITETSIKIGGLGTLSNAGTSTFQEAEMGARARFDRENATGGVAGRKIDFIGMSDDGANVQQNADAGRKLAEIEKVFAVAPITTGLPNYADALCDNVVPGFGLTMNTGLCKRANLFGITGCLLPDKYDSGAVGPLAELLKDSTDKSVVLLGVDASAGIEAIEDATAGIGRAGLTVVDSYTTLKAGQPPADPSALVRKIMTANDGRPPAMVDHLTDFANVAAVAQALDAAGYEGIQLSALGYDPRLAALPALDDTYSTFRWLPFEETGNPVVRRMTADLQEYGGGTALSLRSAMGWISADMLIAGLEATGENLTVDRFLATVNSPDFQYGDGSFMGATVWPQNHFYAVPCASATQLKDGRYRLAVPLTCNDPIAG
jgi:ABC-type branched-subunit amino acid transport system substrate-binding protein